MHYNELRRAFVTINANAGKCLNLLKLALVTRPSPKGLSGPLPGSDPGV